MITLENRIMEQIRHIILDEELEDLKKDFFKNKVGILTFFKKFEMNEITKKYIETFEKIMGKIESFNEEEFEKIKETFREKEKGLEYKFSFEIMNGELEFNKHNRLVVSERFEELSFSLYEYMIKQYNELENKTEEEKKELLLKTSLIHNYLRDYSFAATADATAKLKLACRDGKEGWKKML